MVYKNDEDGSLIIYDWKRAKQIVKTSNFNKYAITECIDHLPDTNFWHYSLQLNIYKFILEKNYGVTISKLCLVRLHPNSKKSFELIKLPILKKEVEDLFEERKKAINEKNNML